MYVRTAQCCLGGGRGGQDTKYFQKKYHNFLKPCHLIFVGEKITNRFCDIDGLVDAGHDRLHQAAKESPEQTFQNVFS